LPEPPQSTYRESIKSNFSLPENLPYRDDLSDSVTISESQSRAAQESTDTLDFTVVHFNSSCSIRGKHGKYLTAVCDEQSTENILSSASLDNTNMSMSAKINASKATAIQAQSTKIYLLNANGQGIGELNDAIQFVSVDNR